VGVSQAGGPGPGLTGHGYPGFSPAEMDRRRRALAGVLDQHGIDHALLYGADRSG
jgi:hypothetical protein